MMLQQHTHISERKVFKRHVESNFSCAFISLCHCGVESKRGRIRFACEAMITLHVRRWTIVGLLIALFSGLLVSALFTVLRIPLTAQYVLFQTAILFACAALLLFIIRRKERLGWDSVGLQRPPLGNTAIWVVVTFVGVLVALAMAFALIKLLHLPVGSMDSQALAALPKWVLLVAIIRAGFIEELFCRGYAIERLQSLTGSLIL